MTSNTPSKSGRASQKSFLGAAVRSSLLNSGLQFVWLIASFVLALTLFFAANPNPNYNGMGPLILFGDLFLFGFGVLSAASIIAALYYLWLRRYVMAIGIVAGLVFSLTPIVWAGAAVVTRIMVGPAPMTITYRNYEIVPSQTTIKVGTKFEVVTDGTYHKPYTNDPEFNIETPNGLLTPADYSKPSFFASGISGTFDKPGAITLLCHLHSQMSTTLVIKP